jgi:arylsulfatase A
MIKFAIPTVLCLFSFVFSVIGAERLPNVVVIFTDDLGYADIGSFGAKGYETPHLDRLAAEGRRRRSARPPGPGS